MKTIQVEIDAAGHLRPLEPIPLGHPMRAVLVLSDEPPPASPAPSGTAARALALLATPRYAKRPRSDPAEVHKRLAALRTDWDSDR
ncbi:MULTISPECIES: hypothetical protein [unclassified Thiocapsa]|uniref:hypothetical protein n=1 Tax=unclassified Thiocapsa TaxID=2641286 RepID=UPI0035AE568B